MFMSMKRTSDENPIRVSLNQTEALEMFLLRNRFSAMDFSTSLA